MTSALNVEGEVTMTCASQQVIVKGLGDTVEIEVPGLLWALRRLGVMRSAASSRFLSQIHCKSGMSVTFRTRRRRLITIRPDEASRLAGWLGLPSVRVHLFG